MPEEKKTTEGTLDSAIDSIFSDTPSAPISRKSAAKESEKKPAPTAQASAEKSDAANSAVHTAKSATRPTPVRGTPTGAAKAGASEKPGAAAAKNNAAGTEPAKSATEKGDAAKSAAPATAPKQRQGITLSDLQKMINAPRPEKPIEKEPVWSMILIVCSMILSMMVLVISAVTAYFYFAGAFMSQILCVLFGVLVVLFVLALTFMLRKIEKGIREIKTKL